MAATMPLSLFYQWRAYQEINPLALSAEYRQGRADWSAGMLGSVFANTITGLWAKKPSKLQPGDLMFKKPVEKKPKTSKELYDNFKEALLLTAPKETRKKAEA